MGAARAMGATYDVVAGVGLSIDPSMACIISGVNIDGALDAAPGGGGGGSVSVWGGGKPTAVMERR